MIVRIYKIISNAVSQAPSSQFSTDAGQIRMSESGEIVRLVPQTNQIQNQIGLNDAGSRVAYSNQCYYENQVHGHRDQIKSSKISLK